MQAVGVPSIFRAVADEPGCNTWLEIKEAHGKQDHQKALNKKDNGTTVGREDIQTLLHNRSSPGGYTRVHEHRCHVKNTQIRQQS